MKISIIGSDARYEYASRELKKYGFDVTTDAIKNADAVLIPINQRGATVVVKGKKLALADVVKANAGAAFFGGAALDGELCEVFDGARRFDITKNEEFAAENARLTAEGALGILINDLPVAVRGARVAVLGYGRVGRALVDVLMPLGALVTVFARSEEARAEAGKICAAREFSSFDGCFDAVVNTVPARVLTKKQKKRISEDAFIIELASAPGGFCQSDVSHFGARYINAPGLPGKTSPASAGKIMAKAIYDIIKGENNK
ncbi:MAG: hypothetical protein IKP68_12695 [Clostridia bacterium]|nr:hypothetical protein [Clostridia bacterium]